ncbi:MAG: uracil-DNA glycosylase family protein [Flavobacteriaceae bacterium]
MFHHTHPYPPYIPANATKLIVGTLPPPRFTTRELKEGDVDFCYGSRDGQLWPILNEIFQLNLLFETTESAVLQRKQFLKNRGIGICDIVQSSQRQKVDASDLGMQDVALRDLIHILKGYPSVEMLLFTGGNSKNGPEYFFRKLIRQYQIELEVLSDTVPRIHQFIHPTTQKRIKTVSLIAPSGAANRAVGSLPEFKKLKNKHPEMTTVDFRVLQYKKFF